MAVHNFCSKISPVLYKCDAMAIQDSCCCVAEQLQYAFKKNILVASHISNVSSEPCMQLAVTCLV